jgi:hypothetical protein
MDDLRSVLFQYVPQREIADAEPLHALGIDSLSMLEFYRGVRELAGVSERLLAVQDAPTLAGVLAALQTAGRAPRIS